jgi:insulysin
LEEKIELFLDLLRKSILEMSDEDYALHVSSLVLSLSEKPKYLGHETWQHWCSVRSGVYEFQSREINLSFSSNRIGETDIAYIKQISKEELLSFVDKFIHPSSPDRSVLSVHIQSQVEKRAPSPNDELVEGIRLFLAGEDYEIPLPELTQAVEVETSLIKQSLRDLILKHGYESQRVEQTLERAEILNAPKINGEAKSVALKEVNAKDLEFRNTLKIDEKPAPIQPLETFRQEKCSSRFLNVSDARVEALLVNFPLLLGF